MTADEFRARMETIRAEDWSVEKRHAEADALMMQALRSCGYGEGVDIYERIARYHG